MTTTTTDAVGDTQMGGTSPTATSTMEKTIERSGDVADAELETRVDPDAQTTVTDFLDFTEYLPSDIVRSLTLIGKLDETYIEASTKVNDLTTTWGQLPTLPADARPEPVKLRADISDYLDQGLSSRVFAHAEAVRMSENVHRHYNKAQALLTKLQTMMDNYPAEELRSPTASKSPQLVRSKLASRPGGEDGKKIRHKRIPKITVPGEVLAPYDIEYDTFSDDSDVSSDEESDIPATVRRTPSTIPKIKLVSNKSPKPRAPRPVTFNDAALSAAAAANAAALLNPPPENAVIGSADAPWLQLTQYELAKLRKRMKKNATWTPSETMIARELKTLCRGPEAYREAKKKAEEEGRVFEPKIPAPVVDAESGTQHLPAGAISVDSLVNDDVPTSNRGMKLNEAKKLKREAMAKLAAEEAGESEKKPADTAKSSRHLAPPSTGPTESTKDEKDRGTSRTNNKRKRGIEGEAAGETTGGVETPSRPQFKRSKTETPVPPPQRPGAGPSQNHSGSQYAGSATPTETPVPIPRPPMRNSVTGSSPASASSNTVTTSVPTKAPAQTPVPLPPTVASSMAKAVNSETPSGSGTKRQTRGEAAKQSLQTADPFAALEAPSLRSASRGATPSTTPAPDRRPASRGDKAASQEPQSTLAAARPRRASTARNTPAPETRPPTKRSKRPAPGIVSTTSSGGNSAVGKRKAAPRKKARTTKRDKDQPAETEMEDVDDEGNPIDPDEPRYCTCNRVSFGTMIQCDNDVSASLVA